MIPPSAKTMITIRAAIAATSRPYSTAETAEAPSSFAARDRANPRKHVKFLP